MKLDDRTREGLRGEAEQFDPELGRSRERVSRRPGRPPRRRFPVVGAAVLVTVVGAVSGLAIARDDRPGVSTGQTGPAASAPSTTTAATTPASDVIPSSPPAPRAAIALGPGCEGPRWRVLLPAGWHFNAFEQHEAERIEQCSWLGPEPIVIRAWGVDDGLGPASNGWVSIVVDTTPWRQVLETETVSNAYRPIQAADRYTVNGRSALRALYRDEIGRQLVAEWWVDAGDGTVRIRTGIPTSFDVDRDRLDAIDSIVSSLVVLT